MAIKCDIHVLHLNESEAELNRCLDSLKHPDLNVAVLAGLAGQIGLARRNGYALGEALYVSSADPDDVYDSSVILQMVEVLENDPAVGVVYSGETIIDEQGNSSYLFEPFDAKQLVKTPMSVHGVIVFRRTAITHSFSGLIRFRSRYERWFSVLFAHFAGYKIVGVDMPGRTWYKHAGQTSKKVSSYDTMLIKFFLTHRNFIRLGL